jgi:hypothetical protein
MDREFFIESISSTYGRSVLIPIVFSLVNFSTGSLFPETFVEGISIRWLDASFLVPSVLIFVIARLFKPSTRPILFNALIWISAGLFSAIFPVLVVFSVTGTLSPYLLQQVPVGLISVPLLVAVTAIVSSGLRISRGRLRQLRVDKEILTSAREEIEEKLEIARGEIYRGVEVELEKARRALVDVSDPTKLAQALFHAIDEVIRPLSHRLAGLNRRERSVKISPPPSDLIFPDKRVALARLSAPQVFATLFLVFILPASFVFQGVQGFETAFILLVIEVFLLWVIERTALEVSVSRIVGILLYAALSTIFGSLYFLFMNEDGLSPIAAGYVTTSLAVTGLMSLVSRRLDDLQRLALVNLQLQNILTLRRQEAWVSMNALAKVIHGDLQSKFLAVALRLSKPHVSGADLDQARTDIDSVILSVSNTAGLQAEPFATQFQAIVGAWDGVCLINLDATTETLTLLDASAIGRSCVIQVISEAIANAAKHSKSPVIQVTLKHPREGLVSISISSDGKLSELPANKGLGSQLLDEVTSKWNLVNQADRVTLNAEIPISSSAVFKNGRRLSAEWQGD